MPQNNDDVHLLAYVVVMLFVITITPLLIIVTFNGHDINQEKLGIVNDNRTEFNITLNETIENFTWVDSVISFYENDTTEDNSTISLLYGEAYFDYEDRNDDVFEYGNVTETDEPSTE